MGKIIWLASYPKSGNTWLRLLFSNLISESTHPQQINDILLNSIASSRELLDRYTGIESSDLTDDEVFNLRPLAYKELSDSTKEEFIFVKAHDAWLSSPEGLPLFPHEATKCVLYIIRHPLDVAVSNAIHNSISYKHAFENLLNPQYTLAPGKNKIDIQIKQIISSWGNHAASWIKQSQLPILVIRYEDLIDDTFSTFKKCVRFTGLGYTDQEIKQAVGFSTFEAVQSQEEQFGFKEKPFNSPSFFRSGRYGNWKSIYSINDMKALISSSNEIISEYGYGI